MMMCCGARLSEGAAALNVSHLDVDGAVDRQRRDAAARADGARGGERRRSQGERRDGPALSEVSAGEGSLGEARVVGEGVGEAIGVEGEESFLQIKRNGKVEAVGGWAGKTKSQRRTGRRKSSLMMVCLAAHHGQAELTPGVVEGLIRGDKQSPSRQSESGCRVATDSVDKLQAWRRPLGKTTRNAPRKQIVHTLAPPVRQIRVVAVNESRRAGSLQREAPRSDKEFVHPRKSRQPSAQIC